MKLKFFCLAAVLTCCLSCIETNDNIGVELLPLSQQYDFYTMELPIEEIEMKTADGLSGFSSSRITVGAIKDSEYGISTRSSAITLIPMFIDSLEIGKNPIFHSFHFAAALDTTSFYKANEEAALQTINVYEMAEVLDKEKSYDCNYVVNHGNQKLSRSSVVYNGLDSLTFNFTKEYAEKFFSLTEEDFKDYDSYVKKFPGIVLTAQEPEQDGGRINAFELQLGYDANNGLTGNLARLNYSAEFKGERRDTSIMFYYGATGFYDVDSLFTNSGKGSFPQYCLNTSTHQTDKLQGKASEKVFVEGGGGLKPIISAEYLKEITENAIASKGGNPRSSVINKATIILPFEFPEDYLEMNFWPQILSPTCKILSEDTDGKEIASFAGLTDASSSDENQGDIDRSNLVYCPDITYHLQSLIRIDKTDTEKITTKRLLNGSYDTWFLIMANEAKYTTSSGDQNMSEYYNYLAYQSYYNSMYGGGYGYGGYGGYGSGYGSYYSNYYSYAMLAAAANQSTTSKSYSVELDRDRFYSAALNGPSHPSGRVPKLRITFGIPKE